MTAMQRLHGEKFCLVFLTGHPIDGYESEIRQFANPHQDCAQVSKVSGWQEW